MIGCNDDDMKLLIAKSFVIPFEIGVCVIKHWKIHNYIQKDRYKETSYIDEKKCLTTTENGAYSITDTRCIQNVSSTDTQVRLGKDSLELGKDSRVVMGAQTASITTKTKFIQPTLNEVTSFCQERNNNIDPQQFIDYYSANGWRVGKNPMRDWKAAIRTWERNERERSVPKQPYQAPHKETRNERNNRLIAEQLAREVEHDNAGINAIIEYDAYELQ